MVRVDSGEHEDEEEEEDEGKERDEEQGMEVMRHTLEDTGDLSRDDSSLSHAQALVPSLHATSLLSFSFLLPLFTPSPSETPCTGCMHLETDS